MSEAGQDDRFPIGRFTYVESRSPETRARTIADIAEMPQLMRKAVAGLSDEQLDTPYRDGGWTVRQLAHHVPDSHLNAYCRFKLGLTENDPVIKPYDEAAWAELADTRETPVETSLVLLDSVHERWVNLMRAMSDADWNRGVIHPEHGRRIPLTELGALYAWHSKHHVAHINKLRERKGWS